MKLVIGCLLLLFASAPAFAVDLNVNLESPILTADGKPKKECLEADKATPPSCISTRDLSLGIVAMEALGSSDPDLRGDEKAKAGALAIKVAGAKEMVLTLEEAALIKKQVNKVFDPVTVARVNAMLDPGAK